jgi:hypothetical protein
MMLKEVAPQEARVNNNWAEIILADTSPSEVWADIFSILKEKALSISSPATLHAETVEPDRLLSEAAWELWESFPKEAEKTSTRLASWTTSSNVAGGKAVLILDALSLRELFIIAEAAKNRGIALSHIAVTGSECPSTTDEFARSLGVPSRASLSDDKKGAAFIPFNRNCYTDVCNTPFEDSNIPPSPNLFIWHSWLDDLIHQDKPPDVLESVISKTLQSDGFWGFINKLRRGRKLLITSDHGYAVSKSFSTEVQDPSAVHFLKRNFGATRLCKAQGEWPIRTVPPIGVTIKGQRVITGQRKWKIQGGFPHICHGGLTLLEALAPWIEMEAL